MEVLMSRTVAGCWAAAITDVPKNIAAKATDLINLVFIFNFFLGGASEGESPVHAH